VYKEGASWMKIQDTIWGTGSISISISISISMVILPFKFYNILNVFSYFLATFLNMLMLFINETFNGKNMIFGSSKIMTKIIPKLY